MIESERLNVQRPQQLREYRPFEVQLQVTSILTFRVDARTPEQAETIAEELVAEGEVGSIDSTDIEVLEVYAVDNDPTGFV